VPIYLHDARAAVRFEIRGDFSGTAVTDLHNSWRTALSILNGKALLLDISRMTAIDEPGTELIARMQQEGAQLIARSSSPERPTAGIRVRLRESVRGFLKMCGQAGEGV
jgi:hypothetical protein